MQALSPLKSPYRGYSSPACFIEELGPLLRPEKLRTKIEFELTAFLLTAVIGLPGRVRGRSGSWKTRGQEWL